MRCAINKGCYPYYLGKKYLRKDKKEYTQKIAQKEYCEKKLGRPLVKPMEDEIREFENISYVGKPFDENDRTAYYTIKGERVRSKSEKVISFSLKMLSPSTNVPLGKYN